MVKYRRYKASLFVINGTKPHANIRNRDVGQLNPGNKRGYKASLFALAPASAPAPAETPAGLENTVATVVGDTDL